jgi:hypothetical protein
MNWGLIMDRTYWQKQTPDKPLFPDLLWSRPENKQQRGKLLIVGGQSQGFAAAAEAYSAAVKSGIGTARVLLPDSLQKTVGRVFEAGEYAPSTPVGSFAKQALADLLDLAAWSDGVLLAGDFGRNSETAVMLELFIQNYKGQLTLTDDSLDYFLQNSDLLTNRNETLLAPTLSQLQKIASKSAVAITSKLPLLQLVEIFHELTKQRAINLIYRREEASIISVHGQVSTMPESGNLLKMAVHASVWWLQNPSSPFESITSSQL